MSDCIFCRIVKNTIPARRAYEDEQCLVFEDINPQAPVHLLVIPKRHLSSLAEAQESDSDLIGHLLITCAQMAREREMENSGYRVVANTGPGAGQSVFHLHFHVLGGRMFDWPPG